MNYEYQCLRCQTIYFKPQECDWCPWEFAVRKEDEEKTDVEITEDQSLEAL